jgi:hypothetical protein
VPLLLQMMVICCWGDCCWGLSNVGAGTAAECCCCCWDECCWGWLVLQLRAGLLMTCALADGRCVKLVLWGAPVERAGVDCCCVLRRVAPSRYALSGGR